MSAHTPRIFARDEGDHFDLLGSRATVKVAGAETGGAMTVIEVLAPRGFGPPLHRHDVEDELFHVTEGALWVSCDGQEQTLGPGGTVWLPKGLPHQFQAVGETTTRFLQISAPAQFEDMVAALGPRLDDAGLPEPVEIDPAKVAEVCARFQVEVLGPPPASLD